MTQSPKRISLIYLVRPTHYLRRLKKQALENILVKNHEIFAGHLKTIGMNTEF